MRYGFNKTEILTQLADAGISEAIVTYDGYGDSGQIEDVDAFDANGDKMDVDAETDSFLRQAASEALSFQGIDWYNNEGAFGIVTFNVAENLAYIENNQRHSSSTFRDYTI